MNFSELGNSVATTTNVFLRLGDVMVTMIALMARMKWDAHLVHALKVNSDVTTRSKQLDFVFVGVAGFF